MTSAPESPGVYLITCTATNKRYVGCSANIKNRWKTHLKDLRKQCHSNKHLQAAYNEHGLDSFEFKVLELTKIEYRYAREDHYIQLLKPEYNIQDNPWVAPTNEKEALVLKIMHLRRDKLDWRRKIEYDKRFATEMQRLLQMTEKSLNGSLLKAEMISKKSDQTFEPKAILKRLSKNKYL